MEETKRGGARVAVVVVLAALFGSSLYGLGRAQGAGETPGPAASDEPAAAVTERLAPSVVRIEHASGQGSGVVYGEDGLILTAGHVVAGVTGVEVTTAEGDSLQGDVVGIDPATDIAVVDVGEDLPVPDLGSDDDVRVGQLAVAIGSPYGLDESVTLGIVSALDRSVTTDAGTIDGLIQTDAPINPGSSGGPLADRHGRVVGINHAIASSSGGNEGVGFAVPIGIALDSAEKIADGDVEDGGSPDDLVPDLPFPEHPFGEWDGLEDGSPPELEAAPHECFPGRPGEFLPPDFPDLPPFDPPDIPMPEHVPSGWDTVSAVMNDGDSGRLYEIRLVSGDERMIVTLGDTAALEERAGALSGRPGAEVTEVSGSPASLVEDADRLYLVFDLDGLTGVIDAPATLGGAELVRVAESIRR